jgi:hypothetical protein
MIGDGLVKGENDTSFWMAALMPKAEKLDVKNLKQQAAEPLSAFLRFDPWTDQVITLHTAYEPLLSASDKMPFEVTPVYIKLSYFKPPVDAAPPAAADPNAAPPAAAAPVDPNATPAAPPVQDQTAPVAAPAPAPAPQGAK